MNIVAYENRIELQLARNHLCQFLLTKHPISKGMGAGSGSRIINLTSLAHKTRSVRSDNYHFSGGMERALASLRSIRESKSFSHHLFANSLVDGKIDTLAQCVAKTHNIL